MKKIVILQHSPSTSVQGQLANQLWNFMSVYAYSREKGVPCYNYSFFEYQRFYRMPVGNPLIRLFYFTPFTLLSRGIPEEILIPLWRKWYKLFVLYVERFHSRALVTSGNSAEKNGPFYLPPTSSNTAELTQKEHCDTLYTEGWLFRNPAGILKHRKEILEQFRPKEYIEKKIATYLAPLRERYSHVIGVHIRQGDYKTFKGGRYYVDTKRAREIIDEYIRFRALDPEQTVCVIASNGKIDSAVFDGLHIQISTHGAAEDLHLLSQCDVVLGSDSSFGNFAAYYGGIAHIIFKKEPLDWEYYRDKIDYFENKYCTLVHF